MSYPKPLPESFYRQPTLDAARSLLGKILIRKGPREKISGLIVETEAYLGPGDPASHAHRGPTPRSAIMFGPPGRAYVYLCYGAHYLLNAVTEEEGRPGAVLIRSAVLVEHPAGGRAKAAGRLISGPGRLTGTFGINLKWNGWDLTRGRELFIGEGVSFSDREIAAGPRVGIRRGRNRPWRFVYLPPFRKTR